jgi:hypothetical protein
MKSSKKADDIIVTDPDAAMRRFEADGRDKPHLGPEDFHSGPQAAARFRAAAIRLARLPKSAVPSHQPSKRSKKK